MLEKASEEAYLANLPHFNDWHKASPVNKGCRLIPIRLWYIGNNTWICECDAFVTSVTLWYHLLIPKVWRLGTYSTPITLSVLYHDHLSQLTVVVCPSFVPTKAKANGKHIAQYNSTVTVVWLFSVKPATHEPGASRRQQRNFNNYFTHLIYAISHL